MDKPKPRILSGVDVELSGKFTGKESYTCYEIEVELDNGLHERLWIPKEFVAYDHSVSDATKQYMATLFDKIIKDIDTAHVRDINKEGVKNGT